MKLTDIVFRGFKIPGARFRGKVRMVKIVTPIALNDLKTDLKMEERNMLYLRNPYLTLEQSKGLTEELKKQEIKPVVKFLEGRDQKFSLKSKTVMDQFKYLKNSDDWDVIK